MGGGGGLALNQLLVVMDGIDDPPLTKRFLTNRVNTFLDALYVVPRRVGRLPLRLKPPKPRKEEIYFIGATQRAAGARSTRRSCARAAWAATSTSARPRGRTAATSSTST